MMAYALLCVALICVVPLGILALLIGWASLPTRAEREQGTAHEQ